MISISLESVEPVLCDAIREDDPCREDYLDEER
jgi:hypothetical protein